MIIIILLIALIKYHQNIYTIHLNIIVKKKHRLFILLLASSCLCFNEISAQSNKFCGWTFNSQSIKISNKFSFQFDNQFRTTDGWKSADMYLMRTGIALAMKKGYSISAGYIFADLWKTIDDIRGDISENRLWQQIQYSKKNKKTNFQHRIRIEETWVPVVATRYNKLYKQDEHIGSKIRYSAKWQWPFSGNVTFQKGFYSSIQDEIIFNFTGARYNNNMLVDQTRTLASIGYRINKHLDIESGNIFMCLLNKEKQTIITNAIHLTSAIRL